MPERKQKGSWEIIVEAYERELKNAKTPEEAARIQAAMDASLTEANKEALSGVKPYRKKAKRSSTKRLTNEDLLNSDKYRLDLSLPETIDPQESRYTFSIVNRINEHHEPIGRESVYATSEKSEALFRTMAKKIGYTPQTMRGGYSRCRF